MKSLLIRLLLLLGTAGTLNAFVVIEDFDYSSIATGGTLAGNANGGVGWNGGWLGNTSVFYNSTIDLVYGQYPLETDTTSGSVGASSVSNYRSIYRNLAQTATGEIWFSYVFRKGGTGAGGLVFNATSDHATGAPTNWNILIDTAGNLNVTTNGTTTSLGAITNAVDYLVLGRVVTGTSGQFQLWLSPNLSGLTSFDEFTATPNYTYAGGGTIDAISSLGVSSYRGTGTSSVLRIDALRLSDGGGNAGVAFESVTGVAAIPEPATMSALFGAAVLALALRRRAARNQQA